MRPRGVPVAVLLLISASLVVQASPSEDLYWEGEEDASNEFLEVKDEDIGISGHLKRLKRDFFDFLSPFTTSTTSTTTPPPQEEIATEDPDADQTEDVDHGSGSHDPVEADLKEKTLRVTFVVIQPYQSEYSNRDSEQFQSFSKAIADAANLLYEKQKLPGTQKASLVRIQSRISDDFSCKVTMDIITSGYDDTDRIAQILRDHIRNHSRLGSVVVDNREELKTNVIDPGYTEPQCSPDEIQCGDDTCVPGSRRCDGINDCSDGSDERGCPSDIWSEQDMDQSQIAPDCERYSCASSSKTICVEKRCDSFMDCPEGDDEDNCKAVTDRESENEIPRGDTDGSVDVFDSETTTPASTRETTTPRESFTCPPGEFSCDETRCVSFEKRCDRRADCYDGADEQGCDTGSQVMVRLHDPKPTQRSRLGMLSAYVGGRMMFKCCNHISLSLNCSLATDL
ncbi:atrial natriuretic peptide-converting enzyme-like [Ostrinia furnacalis]|uniref:atrial natriuretic peptide-converting enzyme-like n=1 Tax=Ostrinia furnacalis TaxID=93504 RepID=UPI00104070A9|nr:atrial natriuretic peptide-converting enzyme-like [Ostrinia furnacalis]